jgi:hypothetical protein
MTMNSFLIILTFAGTIMATASLANGMTKDQISKLPQDKVQVNPEAMRAVIFRQL